MTPQLRPVPPPVTVGADASMLSWPAVPELPVVRKPGALARAIIIDLDDTLYPREQFVRSGFAAIAMYVEALYAIPAAAALASLMRAHEMGEAGRELQALCREHALEDALIPRLVQIFRRHRPLVRLRPGAAVALSALRESGWRIAVVTNGLPAVQRSKVLALGLTPRVDHVIYAEEHAPGGKPAPGAFHEALRRLDLPASRCVCVGDDLDRDIAGGRALRMQTVRLAASGVADAVTGDADVVIASLNELPAVAAALLHTVAADVA